jgi:oligopeptide/dipeptide ABC transporter ATP-binding protein
MSAIFALDDVSVRFSTEAGVVRAVERVSLAMAPGEILALVGESGSGKSTIGFTVAGLQAPSEGRLFFGGTLLDKAGWKAARRAIQIVFQDPFGALDPRMPVSDIIAEPLMIQRIGDRASRRARAAELAGQVGLPRDALNRYPHEFSGGQRQRIAIARALAPQPSLIVADEPLSALDVSVQSQILNLLQDIRAQHALAMLFISHDLAVVHHLADRVAVLYLGHLVELAPRQALFAGPAHPYTASLLAAVPRLGRKPARRASGIIGEMPSPLAPPPGCVFHTRCPCARPRCSQDVPNLSDITPDHQAACHFPLAGG